jgi:hypothetical protein
MFIGKNLSNGPIGPQFVDVDIKPGSDLNHINNDGNGVTPVAILGSQYLDVTEIDAGTVTFRRYASKRSR